MQSERFDPDRRHHLKLKPRLSKGIHGTDVWPIPERYEKYFTEKDCILLVNTKKDISNEMQELKEKVRVILEAGKQIAGRLHQQ